VTVYLDDMELLKMYGIDLPPGMDRVRNRSMIGAFTCLRFSDTSKITNDSMSKGLMYDRNIKTGEDIIVPTHWVVRQILEAHPEGLPPAISNQKTNKALKDIAKRAGINDKVVITKTKGGKAVTTVYEKWQLVSSHFQPMLVEMAHVQDIHSDIRFFSAKECLFYR
jgi:hypothetical protein